MEGGVAKTDKLISKTHTHTQQTRALLEEPVFVRAAVGRGGGERREEAPQRAGPQTCVCRVPTPATLRVTVAIGTRHVIITWHCRTTTAEL